jgi:hypothetical protein
VFPVRYELDLYIKLWRNSVFKGSERYCYVNMYELQCTHVEREVTKPWAFLATRLCNASSSNCRFRLVYCVIEALRRVYYDRIRLSLRGQDIRGFLFAFDPERHCNKEWQLSHAGRAVVPTWVIAQGRHQRNEYQFIRCDAVKYGSLPTFRTKVLPPPSGLKTGPSILLVSWWLLHWLTLQPYRWR